MTTPAPPPDTVPGDSERSSLFRQEVIAAQQQRWLGPILLDPRLSPAPILLGIGLVLLIVALLVSLMDYSRKTTLTGLLVPDTGLIRVYAPFAGVIITLHVSEGQHVSEGDPLLKLSSQDTNSDGKTYTDAFSEILQERLNQELNEKQRSQQMQKHKLAVLKDRIANLTTQQEATQREIDIVAKHIDINQRSLRLLSANHRKKLVPINQVLDAEKELLSSQATLERLQQNAAVIYMEIEAAENSLIELPLQFETEISTIEKRLLGIRQQKAELMSRNEIVISAPVSGTVSTVQANTASTAQPNVPMLTIIPDDSTLVAHLFGPSASIGLLRSGEDVNIRYDAFPFRRYGLFNGTVTGVSRSGLGAAELPRQLASFANLQQAETFYRVVVSLDSDAVHHGDVRTPLQAGMRLNADISLESMPLYKWLLRPVLSRFDSASS